MVIEENDSRSDAGAVFLSSDCRLENFLEKDHAVNRAKNKFVNCGVYVFNKFIFEKFENQVVSLEKEMLPIIVNENICFGYKTIKGAFDIGTPERYRKYKNFKF